MTDGRIWTRLRPQLDTFAQFAAQVVTGHIFLVHPSLMFRRDAVVEVGGFDEELNAAEDQELIAASCSRAARRASFPRRSSATAATSSR